MPRQWSWPCSGYASTLRTAQVTRQEELRHQNGGPTFLASPDLLGSRLSASGTLVETSTGVRLFSHPCAPCRWHGVLDTSGRSAHRRDPVVACAGRLGPVRAENGPTAERIGRRAAAADTAKDCDGRSNAYCRNCPRHEAPRLLADVAMSRVVFTQRAPSAIRPVNHILDQGEVVMSVNAQDRTRYEALLRT
jgi:hypothetical protein